MPTHESRVRATAALACLILVASRPVFAQAGAKARLIAADSKLSDATYDKGLAPGIAESLGATGVLVWPGAAVVRGRVEALRFFAEQPGLQGAKLSWQPFRIEIAPDSSLAITAGVAVFDVPARGNAVAVHRIGRYLQAWSRVGGEWQLSAAAFVGVVASSETMWKGSIASAELPILRSEGPAGAFIAADSMFASDAGVQGAGKAFSKWATPDASTFAGTGELNVGPERIGAALAGNTAHWEWGAVAAGTSNDGMLGWTVGQAVITPAGGGAPSKSKYLTLWRKMPDGRIRFIADGGNGRP